MGPDDAGNAALVARNRLVGTDVAAATAGVVNLVHKVAVLVAVEIRASDRDHIGRRPGIDADADPRITGGRKVDDSGVGEVFVPI